MSDNQQQQQQLQDSNYYSINEQQLAMSSYNQNDFTRDDYTNQQQQQYHEQQQLQESYQSYSQQTDNTCISGSGGQSEPEKFRKLFVANLNIQTTEESLKSYFIKYGQVIDAVIVKEPKTNKTRCYGFVTFQRAFSVDDVMKQRPHTVDSREIETKRATPREEVGKPGAGVTTKQLFVGGIKEGMSEENLREVFGQYGNIKDINIMRDKETNVIRGFAFVTFDDYDPVDRIVLEKYHTINGYSVSVKKAIPKESEQPGPVKRGGPSGKRGGFTQGAHSGGYGAPMMSGYGDTSGMAGPPGLDNLAFMAQKMLQAAQASGFVPPSGPRGGGGYRGGSNMRGGRGGGRGGAAQQQPQQMNPMNFASDDFDTFNQFNAGMNMAPMGGNGGQSMGRGGGAGGPVRGKKFSRGGAGPYGRGFGRGNKA